MQGQAPSGCCQQHAAQLRTHLGETQINAQADMITLTVTGPGSGYPAGLFAPSELRLASGKTTVLVGTSGSGKSTLLRILAGLEKAPANMQLTGLPENTKRAYMTQDVRLLPWFTVEANAGIGTKLRGEPEDRARVAATLEQLDLSRDAGKYPGQISGGMAQRTALARTLLEDADLILLDEPFAALDAITRRKMQDLVKQHFAGRTTVMVTHDPMEAVRLGHSIYVLSQANPGGPAEIEPFISKKRDDAANAEFLFEALQAS